MDTVAHFQRYWDLSSCREGKSKAGRRLHTLPHAYSLNARGAASANYWWCHFSCRRFHWSSRGVKLTIVARPLPRFTAPTRGNERLRSSAPDYYRSSWANVTSITFVTSSTGNSFNTITTITWSGTRNDGILFGTCFRMVTNTTTRRIRMVGVFILWANTG